MAMYRIVWALAFAGAAALAAPASAANLTTLHSFSVGEGTTPYAGLVTDGKGFLYGTTSLGGIADGGSIFKVATDGSGFATLHLFSGVEGMRPEAGLVTDGAGRFFGTTPFGGTSGRGTVFSINADGGGFATLRNFAGSASGDGQFTYGGLILDRTGTLYGMSEGGGANNLGTIYRLGVDGNGYQQIHQFTNFTTGSSPRSTLLPDGAGNFFGTTGRGGASDLGTVFRMKQDGSSHEVLHSFAAGDGANPINGLVAGPDGMLYGTTLYSGAASSGHGTVFRLHADGTGFEVLHRFDGVEAGNPLAGLLVDAAGTIFGTTEGGGASRRGTVFSLRSDGSDFQVLHSFSFSDGSRPEGTLMADADGNLYGTTQGGGAFGGGTVFKLAGTGFVVAPPVPEPGSWALLLAGLALVGGRMRRSAILASAGNAA